MSNLEQFIGSAKAFSEWCVSVPGDGVAEARTALALLSRLYTQALSLRLPSAVKSAFHGERADDATWYEVFDRSQSLPCNLYSVVFNPHNDPSEEPVVCEIADDIADVFRDLSEGISLYEEGRFAEAEWALRFSFQHHWGRHASSAIYALHCWLDDTANW